MNDKTEKLIEAEAKEFFEFFYYLYEKKEAHTDAADKVQRQIDSLIEPAQKYFDKGYGYVIDDIISRNTRFKMRMRENGNEG